MTNLEIIQAEADAFNKAQDDKGEKRIYALVDTEQWVMPNGKIYTGLYLVLQRGDWRAPVHSWKSDQTYEELGCDVHRALKRTLAVLP